MSKVCRGRENCTASCQMLGCLYEEIEKRKLSERLDKANHFDQEWFYDVMEDVLLNISHMVRHPNAKRATLRSFLIHLAAVCVSWVEHIDARK